MDASSGRSHSTNPVVPKHFYSLDALRGIAALGVVVYHWNHFFYIGTAKPSIDLTRLPFFRVLRLCYTQGWEAVDLFFCLSGFIFFWLYRHKISKRETTTKEFFLLRFSRLYPLHFLTLIFVTVWQMFMLRRYGAFFVYGNNDLYHFVLQLFFASDWGFEKGLSYNGPIWSVSVEVLCYAAFFLVCRLNWLRWWQHAAMICLGYVVATYGPAFVGRGIFSFFIGGAAFYLYKALASRGISPLALKVLTFCLLLFWALQTFNLYMSILYKFYRAHVWRENFELFGRDLAGEFIQFCTLYAYRGLLFPLSIVTLALWETSYGAFAKRTAFLGNLSYSSYLLHFPLQMVVVALFRTFKLDFNFFYKPISMLLFFVVLIPLSLGSFQLFERKCQRAIRDWAGQSLFWARRETAVSKPSDA